jgi:hypothetical protein
MNFDYAIDCLQERSRLLGENVKEWERESDPHATNKPRAEFALNKIAELEEAIEVLNGHEKAQKAQGDRG